MEAASGTEMPFAAFIVYKRKVSFREMSQGQVIDIMTFNPYGLQYYSFRNGKIGFARTVPVFFNKACHRDRSLTSWLIILTAYSITEEVSIISWLSVLYALNGRKWPYGFWLDTKRWIFNVLNFRSYQESRNKGWEGRF